MVRAINHRANMTRKALKIVSKRVTPSPTVRMGKKVTENVCMPMGTMPNAFLTVRHLTPPVHPLIKVWVKSAVMVCMPNVVKTLVGQNINIH